MKEIEFGIFFDDQIPKGTAQMKRYDGRSRRFFLSKDCQNAMSIYRHELAPFVPVAPFEGAVAVKVGFHYFTKDKKKKGRPKVSTPDCDNLVKLFLDCMKPEFWKDDSQICELTVTKEWALSRPYIDVRVWEVPSD